MLQLLYLIPWAAIPVLLVVAELRAKKENDNVELDL